MKRTSLLATALLAVGLALAVTGCSTTPFGTRSAAVRRSPTFALVVSVNGGQPPTDAQFTTLLTKFTPELAARGYVLVADAALADFLIHVQYFPDPTDLTAGSAYVVGIRPNPATYVMTRPAPISAGFGYSSYPGYGYGYGNGYYDAYSDYYGYYPNAPVVAASGSAPAGNRPIHPPRHDDRPPGTDPKDPKDHPPGTDPKDHPPSRFAGTPPPRANPNPGDTNPGQHFRHPPPPRPYSEPTSSGSNSSYSRSDPGYSRSDYGSSSSYSSNNSSYSSSSSSFVGPVQSSSSSSAPLPTPTSSSVSFSSSNSSSSSYSSPAPSSPAPSYSPPADAGTLTKAPE